jgi:folate-binding protein YgfZ
LIEVRGNHRKRFLQSQLTSDVEALEIGRSQLSTVLDRSGRLRGFFFVLEREDRLDLLVPEGAAETAIEHMEQHVIADDVSFSLAGVGRMRIALGPEAVRWMATLPGEQVFPIEAFGSRGFVTWAGDELPFPTLPVEGLETLRVVSGLPEWGREATPGMPVNESYLVESAVSLQKGCFLGQETVTKIAGHRGAARFPVLLRMEVDDTDPSALVGRTFAIGDRGRAGTVLSWATWEGVSYLLTSLFRDFRVEGLDVRCVFDDGGELPARVTLLPLIDTPSPMEQAVGLYH